VTPQPRTLSLQEISEAVTRAFPGQRIRRYRISDSPGAAYEVVVAGRTVFVNQYTGEVLGRLAGMDVSLIVAMHRLHRGLFGGYSQEIGRKIMGCAAIAMLFLLLSGVYLWWPFKRMTSQWSGFSRPLWFDIHNTIGFFSLIILLLLTSSGVILGFEDSIRPLFYRFTGTQEPHAPDFQVIPLPGGNPITLDDALVIARTALPAASPFAINVPDPNEPYFVSMRYSGDRTSETCSAVVIHPYTGRVMFDYSSRTLPAGAKIVVGYHDVHTGDIFGVSSKIVISLASLLAVVQVISGFLMWWKRKSHSQAERSSMAHRSSYGPA
jgi:uncharacterized iron-regulated membrane protein